MTNIRESLTNQPGVIIAGIVAWIQTFIDTTMPAIQWIIAVGTAILVLFNITLKGEELYYKFKFRREEKKKKIESS